MVTVPYKAIAPDYTALHNALVSGDISTAIDMFGRDLVIGTLRGKTLWKDPWTAFCVAAHLHTPHLQEFAAREVLRRSRELGYNSAQQRTALASLPTPLLADVRMYIGGMV